MRRTWYRYNYTSTAQLAVLLCFRASVIGGAILLWIAGRATPGDVTYVLTSYYIIHAYLRDVGMHINNLQRSVNDMEELVAIHAEPIGIADAPDAKPIDIQGGRIMFDAEPEDARQEGGEVVLLSGERGGDGDSLDVVGAIVRLADLPDGAADSSYFAGFGQFCGADERGVLVLTEVSTG